MSQDDLTLDSLRTKFRDFYSLRHTDSAKADAVLGELGASDEADRDIILELAAPKRRIGLTIETPLEALYETIGRAGTPLTDQSGVFSIIAIILTLAAVLVVPIGLALTVLG
jgi:hypothetical protein